MSRRPRNPKTLTQKLSDYDHHQYLLRESLHGLKQDPAYLKSLSAELRTMVCMSSGTEGLLWRLTEELGVSDEMGLVVFSGVDWKNPLTRGLSLASIPIMRAGSQPANLPADPRSLKWVIKECEAIYVPSIVDKRVTHELLIRAIAEQMGSAHEDEGIDPNLTHMRKIMIQGVHPYVPIMALDAEFTLQIGERLLDHVETQSIYRRAHRRAEYGDIALLFHLRSLRHLLGRIDLISFRSHISETDLTLSVSPQMFIVTARRRGRVVGTVESKHPDNWEIGADAAFAFLYSSAHRQARMLVNGIASDPVALDAGFLDAREFERPELHGDFQEVLRVNHVLAYERLLSPKECGLFAEMPPGLPEMRLGRETAGAFPN